jgi:hypothetical protein
MAHQKANMGDPALAAESTIQLGAFSGADHPSTTLHGRPFSVCANSNSSLF